MSLQNKEKFDAYLRLVLGGFAPDDAIGIIYKGESEFFSEIKKTDIYGVINKKYGLNIKKEDCFRRGNMSASSKVVVTFYKLLYYLESRNSVELKSLKG